MPLLADAQCDLKEKLVPCPNAAKGVRCLLISGDGVVSSVHLHTEVLWGDMYTIITESFSVLLRTWDCQTSELNLLITIAKPF